MGMSTYTGNLVRYLSKVRVGRDGQFYTISKGTSSLGKERVPSHFNQRQNWCIHTVASSIRQSYRCPLRVTRPVRRVVIGLHDCLGESGFPVVYSPVSEGEVNRTGYTWDVSEPSRTSGPTP